jgi:hypothetical protein
MSLVVAGKNASVGIVIETTGSNGHLVYTWTLPQDSTGKVVTRGERRQGGAGHV